MNSEKEIKQVISAAEEAKSNHLIEEIILSQELYDVLVEKYESRVSEPAEELNRLAGIPITVNEYLPVPYLVVDVFGNIVY